MWRGRGCTWVVGEWFADCVVRGWLGGMGVDWGQIVEKILINARACRNG